MILQALNGAYARFSHSMRANGKPRVPPYGFSYEKIGFALVIDHDGGLVDVSPVDGELDVPVDPTTTRTSGIESMFLWDKTAYVLGLAPEQKKRTADEHDAFKLQQRTIIGGSTDDGLIAVLRFLDGWQPDIDALKRFQADVVGTNVVFRLDGDGDFIHDRPAAKSIWLDHLARQPASQGRCLVSAEIARIALTHPTIGGVRGAQSSGASIVSFNQDSFVSYGKKQGDNAPVSEAAAFAYTTALNELLRRDSRQKVRIGDATTVFWAEAAKPEDADAAEFAAAFMIAPSPAQLDDQATTRLAREVMQSLEKRRPLAAPELHLDPATRFYILGLSPNAARLSIRFWEATTLGALGDAFHQHWRDLRLEPQPAGRLPPSVAALALRTAPARLDRNGTVKHSFDDVSPRIAGELMRAILSKGRYPGSLLGTLVMRVRADHVIDHARASLIKAIIVRAMRLEGRLPQEDYLVRSDPDDTNEARRLGRLFALLERAQLYALGSDLNSTIRDKYIGAAAATPGSVLVGLEKNSHHHTGRLRRGHSDATWIKKSANPTAVARSVGESLRRDIGHIWMSFSGTLPKQLSVEDQGLFLIGYYQERYGKPRKGEPDEIAASNADDNDNTDHEQE